MTWEEAAAELREALLSSDFVRAVANTGTQRVTVRPIEVKSGPALQIVTEDGVRPTTKTVPVTKAAIEPLLDERYRNWHVETARQTVKVQISKKGRVLLSKGGPPAAPVTAAKGHDREKQHLLDPGDPLFDVIGGDARKRRQVDAFLRALDAALPAEVPDRLRVVDLGCGNAYLTFAAYRHLTERGLDVHLTGVDVREDQRERNTRLAAELGFEKVDFVAGTILDAKVEGAVDVVLALHACDTATDEALARAIEWDARWILAAPCCHKDISRQLRKGTETALTRSGILRERFADVLTDSLRSAILRDQGYAVDVVEFVDSAHTPRNLLLKATKLQATKAVHGNPQGPSGDYQSLVSDWGVRPHLAELLHRIP
ncbi:MAG: SAM-dependent methyltransferase [Hamadaea sp.]|uniref:class I SAM-dependent methyltransferase n=1 Tax=Hamadaea sp. TaxID=2024425 RepID=UPI001834A477|nr:SAM-dependent methyltransferase [Hamadaea sp.]NUR70015.1 SAM-dependent methyltransferase [Hamadaea sp.]NUT19324.1 SAM-dependent methyltransferase [Hamadaea sp.]